MAALPKDIPIYNEDQEKAVLGWLLAGAYAEMEGLERVRTILSGPEDFFIVRHQWIYEAMLAVGGVDYVAVVTQLEAMGKLAEVGGQAEILRLMNFGMDRVSPRNLEQHAIAVHGLSLRRQGLLALQKTARDIHDETLTWSEINRRQQDHWRQLGGSARQPEWLARTLAEGFKERLDTGIEPGLDTGFAMLNRLLKHTFGYGHLVIFAGPTEIAKTQLLAQMAPVVARQCPVLYVTLESPGDRITDRAICAWAGLSRTKFNEARLNPLEKQRAAQYADRFAELPLEIVPLDLMDDIEAHVLSMSVRYGYRRGMVFIDDIDSLIQASLEKLGKGSLLVIAQRLLKLSLVSGWGVVGVKQVLMPRPYNRPDGKTTEQINRGWVDRMEPSLGQIEGGATLEQKGGTVVGMMSTDWVRQHLYKDFTHPDWKRGHLYFVRLKGRDIQRDDDRLASSVYLRWNADLPRFEDPTAGQKADTERTTDEGRTSDSTARVRSGAGLGGPSLPDDPAGAAAPRPDSAVNPGGAGGVARRAADPVGDGAGDGQAGPARPGVKGTDDGDSKLAKHRANDQPATTTGQRVPPVGEGQPLAAAGKEDDPPRFGAPASVPAAPPPTGSTPGVPGLGGPPGTDVAAYKSGQGFTLKPKDKEQST